MVLVRVSDGVLPNRAIPTDGCCELDCVVGDVLLAGGNADRIACWKACMLSDFFCPPIMCIV